uniref:Uncharacterized protein n=1 Tax=Panagrolaimus sp. JU765 TaxID=591449 RepID=A0AC34RAQ3_9BILA
MATNATDAFEKMNFYYDRISSNRYELFDSERALCFYRKRHDNIENSVFMLLAKMSLVISVAFAIFWAHHYTFPFLSGLFFLVSSLLFIPGYVQKCNCARKIHEYEIKMLDLKDDIKWDKLRCSYMAELFTKYVDQNVRDQQRIQQRCVSESETESIKSSCYSSYKSMEQLEFDDEFAISSEKND